jgi:hypothetical protein
MTRATNPFAARFRTWLWLVAGLAGVLAFWLWSVHDIDRVLPWAWRGGWMLPAPSLTWVFLAAGALIALLSGIAILLHTTPPGARLLPPAVSIAIVGAFALDVRVAQAIFSPRSISALAFSLDLLAVAALIASLFLAKRSVWWALLYAVHPVVLLAAPNSWVLSVGVLGAIVPVEADRHQSRTSKIENRTSQLVLAVAAILVVLAAAFWIDHAVAPAQRSPGLIPVLVSALSWGRAPVVVVHAATAMAGVLAFVGLLLAVALQRWKLPAALTHAALLYALCSPTSSLPAAGLPLALAMVCWNRAAWVYAAAGVAFAAIGVFQEPRLPPGLPDWLSLFIWIPLLVTEADELLGHRLRPRIVVSTTGPLSVSSPP